MLIILLKQDTLVIEHHLSGKIAIESIVKNRFQIIFKLGCLS